VLSGDLARVVDVGRVVVRRAQEAQGRCGARRPHRGPDRAVGVEPIARDLAELVDPLGLVETRDQGHLMGQLLGLRSGGRQQQRREQEFF
jgi:hypothetical protein